MMATVPFSPAEDRDLVACVAGSMSTPTIAKRLGRTPEEITERIAALDLKRPKMTTEREGGSARRRGE
jgi:hypothetical protein